MYGLSHLGHDLPSMAIGSLARDRGTNGDFDARIESVAIATCVDACEANPVSATLLGSISAAKIVGGFLLTLFAVV